jgi:hypothetical protein
MEVELKVASAVLPGRLLRLEGAVLLALSGVLYWIGPGELWLFALLFFAPDLSMLGYLGRNRVGAAAYNAVHSYPLPAALVAYGVLAGAPLAVSLALIWTAHIGLDRLIGYGLKYPTAFKDTHLGRL